MKKRKKSVRRRSPARKKNDGLKLGPPARETVWLRSDQDRAAEEEAREYTSTGPRLTAGDLDADWRRADSVGEEAPGGTVATPDQDVVVDVTAGLQHPGRHATAGGHHQPSLHHGPIGARTYALRIGTATEEQSEPGDDHGLSRAGLTRDDGQSR